MGGDFEKIPQIFSSTLRIGSKESVVLGDSFYILSSFSMEIHIVPILLAKI